MIKNMGGFLIFILRPITAVLIAGRESDSNPENLKDSGPLTEPNRHE